MMRSLRSAILLLAALAAVAAAPRARADEPQTIDDLPRKARLALFKSRQSARAENWPEAARIVSEFVADNADEDHYLLRHQLGGYLLKCGRPDAAREAFRAATRLEPRCADSWLSLGELAYQAGDYAEAAEAIYRGYELSPSRPAHLLYYAAAAHLLGGDSAASLPLLEELVYERGELPRLDWYRALISACVNVADAAKGGRAVNRLLADYGGDPAAWELAYQFHAGAGDYEAAAATMTVLGYLRPLTAAESAQLGNLYNAVGTPALAASRFEAALPADADAAEFERLASAYLAAHDRDNALRTLRRALAERPSVRLWSLLGDLHYMEENYAEAREAYERCCELDGEQGRAWLMQGFCAMALEQPDAARPCLERANAFPEQAEAAGRLLARLDAPAP